MAVTAVQKFQTYPLWKASWVALQLLYMTALSLYVGHIMNVHSNFTSSRHRTQSSDNLENNNNSKQQEYFPMQLHISTTAQFITRLKHSNQGRNISADELKGFECFWKHNCANIISFIYIWILQWLVWLIKSKMALIKLMQYHFLLQINIYSLKN